MFRRAIVCWVLSIAGCILVSPAGVWSAPSQPPTPAAPAARDGQHDFDWAVGTWKIHLRRLAQRGVGSNDWVELDGTVTCRFIFDGRAEVEEMNVISADKSLHIQGLAVRLYDPAAHQWSIWWADAKNGSMSPPPVVGEFKDGRGEFIDQETYNGRAVLSRFVWTGTATASPHFEQSMSVDGGRTWEVNWVTDQTRIAP